MVPAYENVDPEQLSQEDLAIITGNQSRLVGVEAATNWAYEQRRGAQRILDFLYLGPSNVIRELRYLEKNGITGIMVVRESRLVGRPLQSLEQASAALGVEPMYVDIAGDQDIIRTFSDTVRSINNHLLSVYHKQAHQRTNDGHMMLDAADFKRGKVLVTCQTGNDISPVVVAAYIMAVLGKDIASAIQFISAQRFCCLFDENRKRLLTTWAEILRARVQVAKSRSMGPEEGTPAASKPKRGFGDVTMDDDEGDELVTNRDRFTGRGAFVPFEDVDG